MDRRAAATTVVSLELLLSLACQPDKSVQPDPSVNHSPVARIQGPSSVREGGHPSPNFSARLSTDPDGDQLTYAWLPGDGRMFSDPGSGTVVSVFPPMQQAVGIPASTRFAVSDSGSQDTLTITIRWGDGTRDSIVPDSEPWNITLTHTYTSPGSYRVEAGVRDDDGGVGSAIATYPVLVFDHTKHQLVAGYDASDLGTLGGNSTRPLDFNDYGKVVGSSLTASGSTHAFLWDNGVLRDLGTLGHERSEARRINNAGLIAGGVWTGTSHETSPIAATWQNGIGAVWDDVSEEFGVTPAAINESGDIAWNAHGHEDPYAWLWRRGGWQRLGALIDPLEMSYGSSINERGQIVGTSAAVYTGEHPEANNHAFLWENGAMRDLGLLGFNPCPSYPDKDCGYAFATSINENGQVVGFSTASNGSLHAVLWENGTIRDLWTVPDVAINMRDQVVINDRGHVAGSSRGEGFFWSDGTLRTLGSLGGGLIAVVDMNEAGTVVGTSRTVSGEQHAFVWTRARGMIDLGTGPHGFKMAWVVGISFYGDIVGYTSPCVLGYDYACDYPTQVRAIIWRKITP